MASRRAPSASETGRTSKPAPESVDTQPGGAGPTRPTARGAAAAAAKRQPEADRQQQREAEDPEQRAGLARELTQTHLREARQRMFGEPGHGPQLGESGQASGDRGEQHLLERVVVAPEVAAEEARDAGVQRPRLGAGEEQVGHQARVIEAVNQRREAAVADLHPLGVRRHQRGIRLATFAQRGREAIRHRLAAQHGQRDARREHRVQEAGRVADAGVTHAMGRAVAEAEVADDARLRVGRAGDEALDDGEAASAASSVSGPLTAKRLTTPTLRRLPDSGMSHIQPSGTIRILMLPVSASSAAMGAARPS